jgi:hypothetical protein
MQSINIIGRPNITIDLPEKPKPNMEKKNPNKNNERKHMCILLLRSKKKIEIKAVIRKTIPKKSIKKIFVSSLSIKGCRATADTSGVMPSGAIAVVISLT